MLNILPAWFEMGSAKVGKLDQHATQSISFFANHVKEFIYFVYLGTLFNVQYCTVVDQCWFAHLDDRRGNVVVLKDFTIKASDCLFFSSSSSCSSFLSLSLSLYPFFVPFCFENWYNKVYCQSHIKQRLNHGL